LNYKGIGAGRRGYGGRRVTGQVVSQRLIRLWRKLQGHWRWQAGLRELLNYSKKKSTNFGAFYCACLQIPLSLPVSPKGEAEADNSINSANFPKKFFSLYFI